MYDGERYRSYTRIQDFLNNELTPRNDGMWFYAHAGGMADIEFVLEYLIENPRPGVRVSCSFSGSSAIIVRIQRGKYKWYLLDSYWLLREPLRSIAKWMGGTEKGGEAGNTDIFYAPVETLIPYNRNDCIILFDAIRRLEDTVLSLGGRLEMTIASTAMGLFRRRYLKREIQTNDKVNEIASDAYIASRVEVFEHECEEAEYFDINSSFPFSMTFSAPGELLGTSKRLKDDDSIKIVKATVTVNDCDLPPVPYRTPEDRRIYFPTGSWSGWFSGVDIQLLEKTGHRIEQIEQVLSFEPFYDLQAYSEEIYNLRKVAEGAERVILKYLLNSLYGKFAEGELKEQYLVNPPAEFFDVPDYDPRTGEGKVYKMPGVYSYFERKKIQHRHVPIAMHITSLSRQWLYEYMIAASKVFYCDTDGFAVPKADAPLYGDSNDLGKLKHEYSIQQAYYHAPKAYAYQKKLAEGFQGPLQYNVKAKGFSRSVDENGDTRALSYADFCGLLEHKEIRVDQFTRVRGMFASGHVHPHDIERRKTFRDSINPKRYFPEGGGRSRPWHVSELQDEVA